MGNKISIKDNEKNYKSALKEAQELNKELGYGKLENWKEEEYERQRRAMIQRGRNKNTK